MSTTPTFTFTKIGASLSRDQVEEALLEWWNSRSVQAPAGTERFIDKMVVHGNGSVTVQLDTRPEVPPTTEEDPRE